ncbi:MAG: 1-deoxy-D-xylulose-5-phosphate reductoisomerase, partial [Balneolales bacterium]
MEPQNLLILGSTGSIGTQTLEIVKQHPNRFRVYGLTAHKNWKLLARQINIYKPKFAILTDGVSVNNLRELINHNETQLLEDNDSLTRIVEHEAVDVVVNSLVGFSGFLPTYFALKAGKKV